MNVYQLIDVCEEWVNDLAVCTVHNQDKLNNPKLTTHLYDVVKICRFIVEATNKHLYGIS